IKNDDKLIQAEGVESLSEAELRQACRDRGVLEFSSVEEMRQQINLYNSVVENEGTDGEEEAKKAYKAASEDSDHAAETAVDHKVSSALIDRVDAMPHKLEKEIDDVDAKIGD
ncbi:mitochondrial proton/calcium exchanger protein-like, partial [Fagus crenata]